MSVCLLDSSEMCLVAEDFCSVARALDSVVNHPPCVFIKSDTGGNHLGWAISVFSQAHREAVYLVAEERELELFPDVHEAMMFLNAEGIFTFTVSSAG